MMPLLSTSITIYAVFYYGLSLLPNKFQNRTSPEFILTATNKAIPSLIHFPYLLPIPLKLFHNYKHISVNCNCCETLQNFPGVAHDYDLTLDGNCYLLNPPNPHQSWNTYDPVLYYGPFFNDILFDPIFSWFLPQLFYRPHLAHIFRK